MAAERGEQLIATRIVLRPIGAPEALALSGLGIASVVQSGLDLGWLARGETAQVGLILLAVPFPLQLVAAVLSYLARDGAAGAAMGVLSTSWLAGGLVDLYSGGAGRSAALGLLLLSAAAALCVSAGTVARSNPLMGAVVLLAALRFALQGVYQCGGSVGWRYGSGVVGLLVAALILYALVAFELKGQERRAMLPTFRTGRGRSALEGDARSQLDGIAHEPGVRQVS